MLPIVLGPADYTRLYNELKADHEGQLARTNSSCTWKRVGRISLTALLGVVTVGGIVAGSVLMAKFGSNTGMHKNGVIALVGTIFPAGFLIGSIFVPWPNRERSNAMKVNELLAGEDLNLAYVTYMEKNDELYFTQHKNFIARILNGDYIDPILLENLNVTRFLEILLAGYSDRFNSDQRYCSDLISKLLRRRNEFEKYPFFKEILLSIAPKITNSVNGLKLEEFAYFTNLNELRLKPNEASDLDRIPNSVVDLTLDASRLKGDFQAALPPNLTKLRLVNKEPQLQIPASTIINILKSMRAGQLELLEINIPQNTSNEQLIEITKEVKRILPIDVRFHFYDSIVSDLKILTYRTLAESYNQLPGSAHLINTIIHIRKPNLD